MEARRVWLTAAGSGVALGLLLGVAAHPSMKPPPDPPWREIAALDVPRQQTYRFVPGGPEDLTPHRPPPGAAWVSSDDPLPSYAPFEYADYAVPAAPPVEPLPPLDPLPAIDPPRHAVRDAAPPAPEPADLAATTEESPSPAEPVGAGTGFGAVLAAYDD